MRTDAEHKNLQVSNSNAYFWETLTTDEILSLRFRDLDLSIKNSYLEPLTSQIEDELSRRNIKIKPHFWLSDDWFTPDGVPGTAIPFYLAHPKLTEIERSLVGYAEGDTSESCLKILRHEMGHVVDNAFDLRRKRMRQILFGKSSLDYPDQYFYKRYSRRFVRHIEDGYAQAHPTEDFAETFAVWLDPASNWKERYKKWPALKKLNYMESLMSEIAGKRPKLNNRILVDPVQALKKTLRQHYEDKKLKWGIIENDKFFDPALYRVFSNSDKFPDNPSAEMFFSEYKGDLLREISRLSKYPQYTVSRMLSCVIKRTRELNLKLAQKEMTAKKHLCYYLSRQIKIFISRGRHLISL